MPSERSWGEISEFYEMYASRVGGWEGDFGKGMLDLIQLLLTDPDITSMYPGTAMICLLIALPDYEEQSVHVQWTAHDTYEIYLTPNINEKPKVTTFHFSEAISKIKEYLGYLNNNKSQHLYL